MQAWLRKLIDLAGARKSVNADFRGKTLAPASQEATDAVFAEHGQSLR